MIFRIAISIGLLFFITSPLSAQEGVTLTIGRLTYSSGFIEQYVSVKNETQRTIVYIRVECGFFNKGALIASDITALRKIAPNTTGFGELLKPSDTRAENTQCRIAEVEYE